MCVLEVPNPRENESGFEIFSDIHIGSCQIYKNDLFASVNAS